MRKFGFPVWIFLGTLIGVAVGTAASFLVPARYESTAELQVVPCQIPERFVGAVSVLPIRQALKAMMQQLLSRGMLTNIIQTYNLYPQERKRLPPEDVIEIMRKDVRVWTHPEDSPTTIRLSFRYQDRILAQRVTADFAMRLVDEYIVMQSSSQKLTVQFLSDMLDKASREWLALKQGQGSAAGRSELRALDLPLAQRHYESLRQKLSDAELLDAMFNRRLGEMLELTDAASLPEKPMSPRRGIFAAGGALGGLLASLVVVFVKKPGRRKPPSSEANS
jgi:uncharacterized protein involved in exopolysaccharide biosynthesis